MTRYRRLDVIGRGQQGLVYRAYDTERERTVALKTLHALDAESVYRLKREFRALANVAHPNLVELYELIIADDERFFTMELVDGIDLVRWAAAHARDPARVATAALALASALGALHRAGKLHRDVKPSNVLVEHGGRVVVLDFGLVAATATADPGAGPGGYLTGTLAYMAPEQVWGATPSVAGDWYMVGATVYEALFGQPPFTGDALQRRIGGQPDPPPTPDGTVPSTLAALVGDLLAFDPTARPGVDEILDRLGAEATDAERAPADAPARPPTLVGRESELSALRGAWAAAATNGLVRVDVHGTSGIGKTSLLEHFLSERTDTEGPVILRGRCHPQESIPFKAIDGVIDELSGLLARRADEFVHALTPPDIGALLRLFPVLGRLRPFAAVAAGERVEGEPHEIRRRAMRALRTLLARLGAEGPLIMWIDDLQWGDLDSVAVLRDLLRTPGTPRGLLLLSFRAEDRDVSEPLRALADGAAAPDTPTREIDLGPLLADDVRALARAGLSADGTPDGDTTALDVIVSESAGSPFFATELVRHFASQPAGVSAVEALDVRRVLEQRIEALPPTRRRVLDLLAVAGHPLDESLAVAAAGVDDAWAELARLCQASLLRTITDSRGASVTTYHDRIRDAALRLVPAAARQALHRQLATALAARPDADPLLLVDHYLEANDRAHAAQYAYASAERAEAALAFDQAARLFARARDLHVAGHPAWALEERIADALVNDGRGGDAAVRYLAAADTLERSEPGRLDVVRLRRLAADQYLRSGYVDDGVATLRTALAAVDLSYPASTRRAMLSLIVNRGRLALARLGARLSGRQTRTAPTAFERERLEACWMAGLGVSVFDSIRGAEFQVRHARLALHTDDPSHRARSLATEAVIMAMEGGARKRERAAVLLAEGNAIARTAGDPRSEAHAHLMGAGVAFFDHRYRDVLARCQDGEELCRTRCVGVTWELANMQFLAAYSLAYLGEMARLRERLPEMLTQARERGDHFALTNYRVGMIALAWLAADDPAEARRQVTDALEGRTRLRSAWQLYMGTSALVQIDLYEERPDAGLARLRQLWPQLRRAQMLRLQSVRIESRLLRARCELAIAAQAARRGDHADTRRLLRRAERARRQIAAEDARWATPLADSLGGVCAALRGERATAVTRLRAAAAGFRGIDLQLHAAAATLHATRLDRDDAAATTGPTATEARTWMRQQHIEDPERLAAVFLPGLA